MMDGVGPPRPSSITVTFFPDFGASSKREQTLSLDELAAVIRTTSKPYKDQLPWLKLARFGDVVTEREAFAMTPTCRSSPASRATTTAR